jgi:hypothetical protein
MDTLVARSLNKNDNPVIADAFLREEDSLSLAATSIEHALACAHERGEERAVRVLHAVMALLSAKAGH